MNDNLFEMDEDENEELTADEADEPAGGFRGWMARVPFGTRTAVLAGVVLGTAGVGVGELINVIGGTGSTCCTS